MYPLSYTFCHTYPDLRDVAAVLICGRFALLFSKLKVNIPVEVSKYFVLSHITNKTCTVDLQIFML